MHSEAQDKVISELQTSISETQSTISELTTERDAEKKGRVNFEMKLVEFEEYRNAMEAEKVKSLGTLILILSILQFYFSYIVYDLGLNIYHVHL